MKIPASALLIAISLLRTSAQELLVPMGAELQYSRGQTGLKGLVRSVLRVEKRDDGGFARTYGTVVQTYDTKGAAIEILYHNADIEIHSGKLVRLDYSCIYSYDGKGKLSQITTYDPDGSIRDKEILSYDGKGRLAGEMNYTGEDKLFAKAVFIHDLEKQPPRY